MREPCTSFRFNTTQRGKAGPSFRPWNLFQLGGGREGEVRGSCTSFRFKTTLRGQGGEVRQEEGEQAQSRHCSLLHLLTFTFSLPPLHLNLAPSHQWRPKHCPHLLLLHPRHPPLPSSSSSFLSALLNLSPSCFPSTTPPYRWRPKHCHQLLLLHCCAQVTDVQGVAGGVVTAIRAAR